jgi:hypothetical protein
VRLVRAFVLGVAALGIPAAAAALVAGTIAQAAQAELELSLGQVLLVSVVRTADGSVTTLGLGVPLIALAGGLLNVAAGLLLARRAG